MTRFLLIALLAFAACGPEDDLDLDPYAVPSDDSDAWLPDEAEDEAPLSPSGERAGVRGQSDATDS